MTFQFWMCMKCGKHARGTAQEITECSREHMCDTDLNGSRCNDCITETTEAKETTNTNQTNNIQLESPPSPPFSDDSAQSASGQTTGET